MKAWQTTSRAGELVLAETDPPRVGADDLLVRVLACGLCRTDLHIIDEEIQRHRESVVPGHQVVGEVVHAGSHVKTFPPGTRVGIAWLRSTCGTCEWCTTGRENLCPRSLYNGWDADGGFAELMVAPAAYCYRLDPSKDPISTAPLLCAGIIGYRALSRARVPDGGVLGIYGFGSSAHITCQLAKARGVHVYAMTRGEANRAVATELGCEFVGDEFGIPPRPLDSAIIFAPAGELVPIALDATVSGGTVVLAGIHMSAIPSINYDSQLFGERDLRSVESNTRADGQAFLRLAAALDLRPHVTTYRFSELPDAVGALRSGSASGSIVIMGD